MCSVFVWSCQLSFYFYEKHTNPNTTDLWRLTTELLLALAIYIDPINSFIYTWRFLLSLEESYTGFTKSVSYAFRVTTIWVVPLISIGLYLSLSLVEAKMVQQIELLVQQSPNADYQLYLQLLNNTNLLDSMVSYWTTIINLTTCLILAITIRYVNKLSESLTRLSLTSSAKEAKSKVELNLRTTVIHILLLVAYTIACILNGDVQTRFANRQKDLDRFASAFVFMSGLVDIFLACIMWFAMDEESN